MQMNVEWRKADQWWSGIGGWEEGMTMGQKGTLGVDEYGHQFDGGNNFLGVYTCIKFYQILHCKYM